MMIIHRNRGEISDRGISDFEVRLFVACNDTVYSVSHGAARLVFRLVDPFGAIWFDLQLPGFQGVDRCECVIEQD